MYGFTLAIFCFVKPSNIPSKFIEYIDVLLFKAVTYTSSICAWRFGERYTWRLRLSKFATL